MRQWDGHAGHRSAVPAAVSAMADSMVDDCRGCSDLAGPVGGHGGMDGWSVCLAVLSGLAVLVLLAALLLAGSRAGSARAPAMRSRLRIPRGPPPRPAGLTLAAVSVLRI